jgi:hypothetical protein
MEHIKERLERIFPNIELYVPPELSNDEQNCSPPHIIDWYEFLERLKTNGLEIKNIKD